MTVPENARAATQQAQRRLREGARRLLASVRQPPPTGPRLVPAPVFVLSCMRSGSTLVRVLLNSHSEICAPHEMHLRHLHVRATDRKYVHAAVEGLDLTERELEHLLWDRVMHRELQRSGKQIIVDKTPGNVLIWKRLRKAWPQARFVFLLRHPAAITDSLVAASSEATRAKNEEKVLTFARHLDAARATLPGLTVRYEELTDDPARVTREICDFLDVRWEEGMLQYGQHDHGDFRRGIGDWSSNIRSGEVRKARPLPAESEVPERLREQARAWGYL